MNKFAYLFLFAIILSACAAKTPTPEAAQQMPAGMGMGAGGMMERHHTQVPEAYAGKTSPVEADSASLARGETIYTRDCATCHGAGGMGDGPAGAALDPKPAPVAHTSQMMSDDYLFWRLSEGGAQFKTAMPAWASLDESSRWDLINYMRALGSGKVQPGPGGAAFDPAVQATQQATLLAQAVSQKVISQAEAETFTLVHDAMEKYSAEHPELLNSGKSADEREAAVKAALVAAGTITLAQADAFQDIHDRLGKANLMP